jgi:two-component system response regulator RegA
MSAILRRLLLVDDDEVLCSVLAAALRKRDFDVVVAHNYQAALAAAARFVFEFAIVDLKFPGGSGLSLVEALTKDRDTRVLMLTGYASIATAVEAVKRRAHYYLAKPATADEIVAALTGDARGSTPVRERPLSINRLQWEHIQRVLTTNGGNVSETARELGMHRRTLQRKLGKRPVRD